MKAGCPFCRIAGEEEDAAIVFQDERFVAFLDHRPLAHGHILLVPRVHAETLLDLPQDLVGPLFERAQRLARALETGLDAHGSFLAINVKISQSVPHLHIHLVPRWKKDGLFAKVFIWKRKPYATPEQMARIAEQIAQALA